MCVYRFWRCSHQTFLSPHGDNQQGKYSGGRVLGGMGKGGGGNEVGGGPRSGGSGDGREGGGEIGVRGRYGRERWRGEVEGRRGGVMGGRGEG